MFRAVTLDGASAGRMTSGLRSAMTFSDGNDSGRAIAIATQTPMTTQGHRATKSASRRISHSPLPASRYATRPQFPLSATNAATDRMAAK
ncbi:hypothetical protein MCHIJ_06860 [Mycolicibacterium chitae]|nr:hypothetical protein MCHIJ_06860 [Mycolicibacterium chitae]